MDAPSCIFTLILFQTSPQAIVLLMQTVSTVPQFSHLSNLLFLLRFHILLPLKKLVLKGLICWVVGVTPQNRGVSLTTRQPTEYSWMSGNPTPLMKIGQSLLCTGSSTLNTTCPKQFTMTTLGPHSSKIATWAHASILTIYISTI